MQKVLLVRVVDKDIYYSFKKVLFDEVQGERLVLGLDDRFIEFDYP